MRLDADFSLLRRAVVQMGADHIQAHDPVSAAAQGRETVDWELPEGIEVDIEAAQRLGWSVREPKQALDEAAPLDAVAGQTTRTDRVGYDRYRPKAAQSRYPRRAGRGRGKYKPRGSS